MSKAGMKAALDTVGAGSPLEQRQARQLEMLPDMRGEADAPSADALQVPEVRGPGRPKGARNKRTKEMLDYIGKRYGFPAERLAQMYSSAPADLAREFGIKPREALDLQKSAAIALLPYMHQKQPVAIDLEKKSTVTLVFNDFREELGEPDDDGFTVTINADGEGIGDV